MTTTEPNTVDLDSVRDKIVAYRAVDERIKALTEAKANLRGDIEEALGDNEIGVLDGRSVVTFKHSKRTSFDQAAFRKADPESFASYQRTAEVRTFRMA